MITEYLPIIAGIAEMAVAIYRKRQRDAAQGDDDIRQRHDLAVESVATNDARDPRDILVPIVDTWVETSQTASIGGLDISGGLFYSDEVQEIDLENGYLPWLCSDRTDAVIGDDLLFRYFWGLERRVLIDWPRRNMSPRDLEPCRREVLRLRQCYSMRTAFVRAAKQFACMSWILSHNIQLSTAAPNPIDRDFCDEACRDLLRWRIAHFAVQFRPIPPIILWAWYDSHPDYGLPESVKSHFDDCYRNFERDFAKSFPQGLRTKPSHRTLAIIYHSTNPQLGALAYDIAGGYDAFDQTRVLTEIEPLIRRSESLLSRCPATR